jgi:signal transduction histidine kinase
MTAAAPEPTLVGDVWGEARPPSLRGIAVDVAGAAVFALLLGLVEASVSTTSLVATLFLGLALALRRAWLPGMVGAALAASVVQLAGSQVAVFGDAAYVVLFFTLGTHRASGVRRFGLACVVVAVVVAGVWTGLTGGTGTGQSATFAGFGMAALATVVTGGGWIAGYLRRQRRQVVQTRVDAGMAAVERRRLEELVEQAQERGRIAADMHDVVAHSWAVVAAQADGARYVLRTDPDRAEEALGVIGETARTAMTDVRTLLTRLRHGEDRSPLLPPEIDDVMARMHSSGMDVRLSCRGEPAAVGPVVATARFALSESLTNALKHGDLAQPVAVEEDWTDGYRLRVVNDVPTRAPVDPASSEGHGLRGMTERVAQLGGRVLAGESSGRWVTEVTIPGRAS